MEGRFIDTSVLVALFNQEDALHERAKKVLMGIPRPYLIYEYVALETATVLLVRAGKGVANLFIKGLLDNADLRFVPSFENMFLATTATFLESRAKLAFTDAALLTLSYDYEVLTFDEALQKAIKRGKG